MCLMDGEAYTRVSWNTMKESDFETSQSNWIVYVLSRFGGAGWLIG